MEPSPPTGPDRPSRQPVKPQSSTGEQGNKQGAASSPSTGAAPLHRGLGPLPRLMRALPRMFVRQLGTLLQRTGRRPFAKAAARAAPGAYLDRSALTAETPQTKRIAALIKALLTNPESGTGETPRDRIAQTLAAGGQPPEVHRELQFDYNMMWMLQLFSAAREDRHLALLPLNDGSPPPQLEHDRDRQSVIIDIDLSRLGRVRMTCEYGTRSVTIRTESPETAEFLQHRVYEHDFSPYTVTCVHITKMPPRPLDRVRSALRETTGDLWA